MLNYKKVLNDEQFQAANILDGPGLIIAGAGSGKTLTVTYRTARLIEKGINPENILLITFTNKAANEMKQRICGLIPIIQLLILMMQKVLLKKLLMKNYLRKIKERKKEKIIGINYQKDGHLCQC